MWTIAKVERLVIRFLTIARLAPTPRYDRTNTSDPDGFENYVRQILWILNYNATKADVYRWRACIEECVEVCRCFIRWWLAEEKPTDVCMIGQLEPQSGAA